MKLSDGPHTFTTRSDPPEEWHVLVSGNGGTLHRYDPPPEEVLLFDPEQGRYAGPEGYPRWYVDEDGFSVYWTPGIVKVGDMA